MAWTKVTSAGGVTANGATNYPLMAHGFDVYTESSPSATPSVTSPIPGFCGGKFVTVQMRSDGTATAAANTLYVQVSLDGVNWVNQSSAITCAGLIASDTSNSVATYDMTNVKAPFVRFSRALTATSPVIWTVTAK